MFVDPDIHLRSCAPAERDVPALLRELAYISLRWSEEESLVASRSINIESLRDGESELEESC